MATVSIEKEQEITYDVVKEEDAENVLKLLKATFFQDEPLNCYIKLGECKDLEVYCTKSISDGCSFKATNSDGEIVGVFLNGIIKKPSPDEIGEPLASKTSHPKFKKIMALMDFIDTKFNIFDLYPDIKSFVDGKILSVDPKYRGLGIAGQLTDKTIAFMKANNLRIFHVLCTSHFSARVLEKMDFNEVFNVPYSDYVDEDGKQILCPEKPHVAARVFTKEI